MKTLYAPHQRLSFYKWRSDFCVPAFRQTRYTGNDFSLHHCRLIHQIAQLLSCQCYHVLRCFFSVVCCARILHGLSNLFPSLFQERGWHLGVRFPMRWGHLTNPSSNISCCIKDSSLRNKQSSSAAPEATRLYSNTTHESFGGAHLLTIDIFCVGSCCLWHSLGHRHSPISQSSIIKAPAESSLSPEARSLVSNHVRAAL